MHELYELKEMLCDELKEYGAKGDLNTGSLDVVDKLAHAIKNLDKIIVAYEEDEDGYSRRYLPMYAYESGNRSNRGTSYRGRSYAKRDRMGRYSRDGMADKLRDLMHDAPDERVKEEIRKLADKMESM